MDAAFSVVRGGSQWVVRASRLAPARAHRDARRPDHGRGASSRCARSALRVADNDYGLAADLTFAARTAPIEEPRFTHRVHGRARHGLDAPHAVRRLGRHASPSTARRSRSPPADVLGCRDRSWGIRIVGEPEGGAPGHAAAVLLAVGADQLRRRVHALRRQRGRRGTALARQRQRRAASASSTTTPSSTMTAVEHRIRWQPGTRRAASARHRAHARTAASR